MAKNRHASDIISAAGFVSAFNHQLFAMLKRRGIDDEACYRLLNLDETLAVKPEFIERIADVFAEFTGSSTGHSLDLKEMIKRWSKFAGDTSVHPDIVEMNFPTSPGFFTATGVRLVEIRRDASTATVLDILAAKKLRPARLEHMLAFDLHDIQSTRRLHLVALGSILGPASENRRIPVIRNEGSVRKLDLEWICPGDRWDDDYRFLAVAESD